MPDTALLDSPPPADPMTPRPFRVVHRMPETADVMTVTLAPADDLPSIRFRPAQIGMVGLPGLGEVPISFSNDADDTQRVAMTIRAAGKITTALVEAPVGSLVSLRGPYGVPWPLHAAYDRQLLVIAGGLGLAPLRSAIVAFAAARRRVASLTIAYGARTPDDLLFRTDLAAWANRRDIDVLLTVDRTADGWEGEVGVVTNLLDRAVRDPGETVAMMCGPDVMLGIVAGELVGRGVPPDQVWVTTERNMKCGVGLCGHCQLGPLFLCKDGPVFRYDRISHLFGVKEV